MRRTNQSNKGPAEEEVDTEEELKDAHTKNVNKKRVKGDPKPRDGVYELVAYKISPKATETEMKEIFSAYGKIKSVSLRPVENNERRCFLQYHDEESLLKALSGNSQNKDGSVIKVAELPKTKIVLSVSTDNLTTDQVSKIFSGFNPTELSIYRKKSLKGIIRAFVNFDTEENARKAYAQAPASIGDMTIKSARLIPCGKDAKYYQHLN